MQNFTIYLFTINHFQSPPSNFASTNASLSSFNAGFNSANSGLEAVSNVNLVAGGVTGASLSSFEAANYGGDQQGNASFSGFESAQGAGVLVGGGGGGGSGFESAQGVGLGGEFLSAYESNSLSSQGGAGFALGGASTSGYESHSASAAGTNLDGTDPATAAFLAADLNKDGKLDAHEFRKFISSQLQYQ